MLSLLSAEGEAVELWLVHSFLVALALITISRIFIKVRFSESILQCQRTSESLPKFRGFLKEFYLSVLPR